MSRGKNMLFCLGHKSRAYVVGYGGIVPGCLIIEAEQRVILPQLIPPQNALQGALELVL